MAEQNAKMLEFSFAGSKDELKSLVSGVAERLGYRLSIRTPDEFKLTRGAFFALNPNEVRVSFVVRPVPGGFSVTVKGSVIGFKQGRLARMRLAQLATALAEGGKASCKTPVIFKCAKRLNPFAPCNANSPFDMFHAFGTILISQTCAIIAAMAWMSVYGALIVHAVNQRADKTELFFGKIHPRIAALVPQIGISWGDSLGGGTIVGVTAGICLGMLIGSVLLLIELVPALSRGAWLLLAALGIALVAVPEWTSAGIAGAILLFGLPFATFAGYRIAWEIREEGTLIDAPQDEK